MKNMKILKEQDWEKITLSWRNLLIDNIDITEYFDIKLKKNCKFCHEVEKNDK